MNGAFSSYTDRGPPERMNPFGLIERIGFLGVSHGNSSQYTCTSRTRRAINCAYCEPKSMMAIESIVTFERSNVGTLNVGYKMKMKLWKILVIPSVNDQPICTKMEFLHESLHSRIQIGEKSQIV